MQTWKIISSHDRIGIVIGGPADSDSFGDKLPEILGREYEIKELFKFISDEDIEQVVRAHVNMHPDRAEGGFTDFKALDEFVIGPIHTGSFGTNYMDTSFGALYEYGEFYR